MERTFEEEVLERLIRIEEVQKSKEQFCAIHRADTATLDKAINGNGKKGLKDELSDLKTAVSNINVRATIYASVGGFAGGAIVAVVVAFIKR